MGLLLSSVLFRPLMMILIISGLDTDCGSKLSYVIPLENFLESVYMHIYGSMADFGFYTV